MQLQSSFRCIYCGAANTGKKDACHACFEEPVTQQEKEQTRDQFQPSSDAPNISRLTFNFTEENGFAYVDWRLLGKETEEQFSKENWHSVCDQVGRKVLMQLKADLGGTYRCYESDNFLLLCAEGQGPSRAILKYAEGAHERLKIACGKQLARQDYYKPMILVFSDEDDYYTYISHFYPDGEHAISAGVMVGDPVPHIAFPLRFVNESKGTITHELVHHAISHLEVPIWLHEGLAQKLEYMALGERFHLSRSDAEMHHATWNEQTIQEFWGGESFYGPDEMNTLSYSLAFLITELLSEDWNRFLEFVARADARDGGQDAALQVFDTCLGDTVARFLGPGDWRPQRKVIAQLSENYGSTPASGESEEGAGAGSPATIENG